VEQTRGRDNAMKSFGAFGVCAPGLRLALEMKIERNSSADEILQSYLIDLFAFADVDGAPDIPIEAGVEQTCGVLQSGSLGKGHFDDAFVRLSRADDASMGKDGSPHPLPLFDDLGVRLVEDCAHFSEHPAAPVAKFPDPLVYECRSRFCCD